MDERKLPRDFLDRYSGATSQIPTLHPTDIPKTETPKSSGARAIPVSGESPERDPSDRKATPVPWYNPKGWSIRKRLVVAALVVAIIVGVIVGAVEGVKANRYPDYTPLNYSLVDTYQGTSFFDRFDYFAGQDPTNGFVVYVNEDAAQDLNLTHASETSAILRVDSSTPKAIGGRNSVRIESRATYDTGLFVFDIIHTPYGCGTWPALWLTDGYNWPHNGEIDILESTNEASHGNEVTLHTTKGCKMNVKRKQTGGAIYKSCDNSTHGNAGCGVQGDASTYGQAFNENGGGVYALELREAGIRTWFFPRDAIPTDIADTKTAPDPSAWGTPFADFPNTECDIPSHFRNQSIIANIDLCGELGSLPLYYDEMYHCPATCPDFVANNPSSFEEAYWEFASFRVYRAT
ncbi:concanavalin A-like lectin/glucanase domain-containing protein [Penicillium capsulatum]|nr:concanavalin A-like lectin/glucanase domain-containing protein [Penicillium capsulatum]